MGFLNKVFRLFGKDKSKAKPTSSPDKAIQELKGTSEVPESKAKQTSLDKAIRKLKGTGRSSREQGQADLGEQGQADLLPRQSNPGVKGY